MENNYQLSRIHNYVHGLMSRAEMHALEREALEDPFLQDAIDGYKLQQGVDAKQLSILQQRLTTRVHEQVNDKNRRFYSWQRLAIGMAAGVMFMIVCTLLLMRYLPQQRTATLTEVEIMTEERYEVTIIPRTNSTAKPEIGWDSLTTILKEGEYLTTKDTGKVQAFISFQNKPNHKVEGLKIESKAMLTNLSALEQLIGKEVKWTAGNLDFEIHYISK